MEEVLVRVLWTTLGVLELGVARARNERPALEVGSSVDSTGRAGSGFGLRRSENAGGSDREEEEGDDREPHDVRR